MRAAVLIAGLALAGLSAVARAAGDEEGASYQGVRPEAMLSRDAEGNDVRKLSLGWDFWRTDLEHWAGLQVEDAHFSGPGWSHGEQRAYVRGAGTFGAAPVTDDTWRWQARAGSNGHALLGSASVHTEGPSRLEAFFERDLVETQAGIRRGQVYDFAAAAIDHAFTERFSGTLLAGAQDFEDGNLRGHLRGNLVYALLPEQGVSVQLRERYFHNDKPRAGDYYSPRQYEQTLGVLALRRVIGGNTWRAVAGYGRQRAAGESSKRARLLELSYESPRWRRSHLKIIAGYTDTPTVTSAGGAGNYNYRYLMLEWVIPF